MMVLWLRFLNEVNEDMRKAPIEMLEDEYIREAIDLCEEGAFTPEELAAYDGFWDAVRIITLTNCLRILPAYKQPSTFIPLISPPPIRCL